MTNEPTVYEIVKYILKHEREALNTLIYEKTSQPNQKYNVLKKAIEEILGAAPQSQKIREPTDGNSMFNAYTLASKAYDEIVGEREQRYYSYPCAGHVTMSYDDGAYKFLGSNIQDLDKILLVDIGRRIAETFLQQQRPRVIIAPFTGEQYLMLQETKNQELLPLIIRTGLTSGDTVESLTIECNTSRIRTKYRAGLSSSWPLPIGEVTVEFGRMRE